MSIESCMHSSVVTFYSIKKKKSTFGVYNYLFYILIPKNMFIFRYHHWKYRP